MTFPALIKSERARLGLTQAAAATLLDVPARTLWEWEHGKTEPLAVAQEGVGARLSRAKLKKCRECGRPLVRAVEPNGICVHCEEGK